MTTSKPREFWSSVEERETAPRQHLDLRHNADPGWDAIWSSVENTWFFSDDEPLQFKALLAERNAVLEQFNRQEVLDQIEVNSKGGKQSRLDTRYDLIPPAATHEVAKVLKTGSENYGPRNWRKIGTREHLNHALEHVFNALNEDAGRGNWNIEELQHAACRLLFALEIALVGEED